MFYVSIQSMLQVCVILTRLLFHYFFQCLDTFSSVVDWVSSCKNTYSAKVPVFSLRSNNTASLSAPLKLSMVKPYARVDSGPLTERHSSPGGHQLIGQKQQTGPVSLSVHWCRLNIHPSPSVLLLLSQRPNAYFTVPWRWKAELT